ncbi:MAG TPA: TcpE family conjugal transfer membrane protein [Trebonia sp.]|nr:TcpE family conjugal transfer membrane protein [Trebonia sp.]
MDLPTYTNIWRIEKRLYKLYDFRLPMPLPINWIAVFAGITVPYIVLLIAIGLPFNHTLVWLYVLPPGLLTWLTTRPVIENKRLPELVESQARYLTEPRVWTRLTPLNEKDQMVVTARVWHARQAPQRRKAATARAAAGTVALRGRNALARRGVAATVTGDPAEGNAPLAVASALAAAPATAANSRSRARGTGTRVPAPGTSGRQRPPGKRTRPPRQDWAAQQREAARHDELAEETWPAEQPPRVQTTGTEDQAAKPGRFRLSGLRSRPAGQAPELPPGVALRPAEPRRPRFGSLPPSGQEGRARSWPGGPDRPGQAGPAWRMPAIRSAPPLGSVAAPMSSDLPAHATPDVYPASPPAPDVEPTTSARAALPVHPALDIDLGGPVHVAPGVYLSAPVLSPSPAPSTTAAPDEDRAPAVHAAQDAELDAPLGPVSPEVAQDTPSSATTPDAEAATSAPAAPEAGPPDQAPVAADVKPAISAPASSELHASPATPEVDSDAPPVALVGEPATWVHVVPEVDPAAQAPAAADVDQALSPPSAADLGPAALAPGLGNVRSSPPPAPSGGAPRVEISHDGPAQRLVPPAPVPPVNPALAWPTARPESADLSLFSAALTTETGDKSQIPADVPAEEHAEAPEVEAEEADEPRALEVVHEAIAAPQVPVVKAVADAVPLAVPSIERALSGPSKDRNLTWHGKVKIVAGTGQGPGKRDQEALDRARARLPLKTPQRVLMLGCTSGAGQSVTTLMTGHILASLREEPVAAVDLHDGTLAHYSAPAGWLDDMLSGRPPQGAMRARPDGLNPTPKTVPARLDVIASRGPLRDGDELELAVQLTRHYSLTMLDPGAAGLMKLLKIADQLVIVVPASIDGAGALADTRDWLDTHGFAELADHSVTVINGVSRRSLADAAHAESVARGRCRAIVRVPWDDMLPVEVADPSALRPQTRVAYTALAGVLVAGMAAAPVRTSQ